MKFKKILVVFISVCVFLFLMLFLFKADNYARRQIGVCGFLPVYEENERNSRNGNIGNIEEVEHLRNQCKNKSEIYWSNFFKAVLGQANNY